MIAEEKGMATRQVRKGPIVSIRGPASPTPRRPHVLIPLQTHDRISWCWYVCTGGRSGLGVRNHWIERETVGGREKERENICMCVCMYSHHMLLSS